jgi:hypothetical protein
MECWYAYATAQHEAQQEEYNHHATPQRLAQVFDGMQPRYVSILKERLKAHKGQREQLQHKLMQCTNQLHSAPRSAVLGLELLRDEYGEQLAELEALIKKIAFQIHSLTHTDEQGAAANGSRAGVNDSQIARAKEYPIAELLEVNSAGFAKCPFHNEKTASLKVYKNQGTWWCYSENAGGDVIALVMRLEDLTFTQAVRRLCGIM